MTFIVAGCGLLLALLAGIVLSDSGIRRLHRAPDELLRFDVW